ncbi:MAG: hypothetical protein ACYTAF_07250 [Planctomycetota bacterium]
MSVTSFKEIHNGRDGEDQLSSDGKQVSRYTRVFRAVTDNNFDNAASVLAYVDCPRIGWVYPDDLRAFCQRVRPRNESFSKRVWIVTASYSTEREISANPLSDPAEIDWSTAFHTRPATHQRAGPDAGSAIVNAAFDPFDPAVEADDSRWGANVTKNVPGVPSWIGAYGRDGGAVNSDAFYLDGYPVGIRMAKISGITISKWQERNGIPYRVLTMRIDLNEGTWVKQILNDGMRTRDGNNCKDADDRDVTEPALLLASGAQAAFPATLAQINYIDGYVYYELPFAVLPLL